MVLLKMENKQYIAVVRVRGTIGIRKESRDTLKILRLYKKNNCIIIPNTPAYIGMIKKVKDYTTWGEINEETFRLLLQKRGRLPRNKILTQEYLKEKTKLDFDSFVKEVFAFKKTLKDVPGLKLFFRLSPPRKGFERKGIKVQFSQGGALGYRKEKINELIQRML